VYQTQGTTFDEVYPDVTTAYEEKYPELPNHDQLGLECGE